MALVASVAFVSAGDVASAFDNGAANDAAANSVELLRHLALFALSPVGVALLFFFGVNALMKYQDAQSLRRREKALAALQKELRETNDARICACCP